MCLKQTVLLMSKCYFLSVFLEMSEANAFITARIRRMTGGYIFTLCVCPHRGGTYLLGGGGVPTLRSGQGGTYLPGGGYLLSGLDRKVPT